MPGTQPTLGADGTIPTPFTAIAQSLQSIGALTNSNATQTGIVVLDQYQNAPVIIGNLNQVVTIGAGWISSNPVIGVEVGTGLSGFGIAYISAFAHTTIALTEGSTAATVASSSGFANGMVIGATVLEAPPMSDSTAPPNYIEPGTTMTFSGTSVTLSEDALLSGSGLYCCVATFSKLNIDAHP